MRRKSPSTYGSVVPLALAALLAGCPTATGGSVELTLEGGTLVDGGGVWTSTTSWSSDFFEIAADQTATVLHGLGRVPVLIQIYVAFPESPVRVGIASGNLAEIVAVTDTAISIHNFTGTLYVYKIVLL